MLYHHYIGTVFSTLVYELNRSKVSRNFPCCQRWLSCGWTVMPRGPIQSTLYQVVLLNHRPGRTLSWSTCTIKNYGLTHWSRDKMAIILQTTFWNAFSEMKKMCEFPIKFHWNVSTSAHYHNIGSDNGLVPKRRQTIKWTNGGLVCCRICVIRPRFNQLVTRR